MVNQFRTVVSQGRNLTPQEANALSFTALATFFSVKLNAYPIGLTKQADAIDKTLDLIMLQSDLNLDQTL